MKLVNLLDTISKSNVIWISSDPDSDGVFCGYVEDAEANIPRDYLFGEVTSIYAEYYRGYGRSGISIIVYPYQSGK